MRLPTVTVDRGGVAVVINKSDYNPGADRLWGSVAEPEVDEQGELIAKLAKHGVKRDRRSSVGTLIELLAEYE